MKELLKAIITESQTATIPDLKPRKLQIPVDLPFIVSPTRRYSLRVLFFL